jgi:hypothetical protein
LISDGGTSGASWAALRVDLREHYDTGDVIEDSSEPVEEIDRISNDLYAENGLEALAGTKMIERSQGGYKILE